MGAGGVRGSGAHPPPRLVVHRVSFATIMTSSKKEPGAGPRHAKSRRAGVSTPRLDRGLKTATRRSHRMAPARPPIAPDLSLLGPQRSIDCKRSPDPLQPLLT
jgi:hypothetical protein